MRARDKRKSYGALVKKYGRKAASRIVKMANAMEKAAAKKKAASKKKSSTKKGQVRKTARRAYTGLKKKKKKSTTKKKKNDFCWT